MGRLLLYFHTMRYMKPSQIFCRMKKSLGYACSLGCSIQPLISKQVANVASIEELDFDSAFLARFNVNELMEDRVAFLHKSRLCNWEKWEYNEESALWNFNLHYFEFLFPLVDAYRHTGKLDYLNKTKHCIRSWIKFNPCSKGGSGWASYCIALRLTNWLSYISAVQRELEQDVEFFDSMHKSMHEQFSHLATHLEKDILGNHYFENLKAILLCSLYFRDEIVYNQALTAFLKECKEEILPDGMHFELSPMYHKIIFEGILRAAYALRQCGRENALLESYIQPMLNVAYSFEDGLERIPLFNDGGNNVSKSLDALVRAANRCFGVKPVEVSRMPDAGFYIFKNGPWKLVVDAGRPGPDYIPGHAHCDAMSYELFKSGKPILVNCGTYAYQCKERSFYRSTQAHNTVMVEGVEQSQCWGTFRLAKRAKVEVISVEEQGLTMKMTDQNGNVIRRTVLLHNGYVSVHDETKDKMIISYIHSGDIHFRLVTEEQQEVLQMPYAVDYGHATECVAVRITGKHQVKYKVEVDI